MTDVTIYTDGACRGNPGKGGYGAILIFTSGDRQYTKELSQGYTRTTNNRMELLAAIKALEALNRPCNVTLYSDSKYLSDAFNKNYLQSWVKNGWRTTSRTRVKNQDMWERLLELTQKHTVTFHWVKGHNENFFNEKCDRLATGAADKKVLLTDDF